MTPAESKKRVAHALRLVDAGRARHLGLNPVISAGLVRVTRDGPALTKQGRDFLERER